MSSFPHATWADVCESVDRTKSGCVEWGVKRHEGRAWLYLRRGCPFVRLFEGVATCDYVKFPDQLFNSESVARKTG
ncbi:hypothetical protein AHF37_07220 [Paragonimus kellicotti]|nr:hypothetical protein AHF37_07220 [Paragonimus kellicotti]